MVDLGGYTRLDRSRRVECGEVPSSDERELNMDVGNWRWGKQVNDWFSSSETSNDMEGRPILDIVIGK